MKTCLRNLICKWTLLASLLALAACSPPMTSDPVFDFILKLPEAKRDFDLFVIDMSNPNHYRHLRSGWHIPDGDILPFGRYIWSAEVTSVVTLHSVTRENKEIVMTVRPYMFEGNPPVTLTVNFNDTQIGKIQLKDDWRTYRLRVPAEVVLEGENLLTLKQGQVFKPSEVMIHSADNRSLGASYSFIVFRSEQEPQTPGLYTVQQVLGAQNFVWGGKQRHVVFAKAPGLFTWELSLPSRPALSLGTGFLPDGFDPKGPDAGFKVVLTDANSKEHLLFKSNTKPPQRLLEMGWKSYTRNLEPFSGQRVKISLITGDVPNENGVIASGSWLEPHIQNRHIDCNIIFLPVAKFFDSGRIPPGSAFEKLLFSASRSPGSIFSEDKTDSIAGIPIGFLNLLQKEGWLLGYFSQGRPPADRFRQDLEFDVLAGYDSDSENSFESLTEDCQAWIRAVENRRFLMIFDPAGLSSASETDRELLDGFASWLASHRFEMDSIIIVYDPDSMMPVWLLNPFDRNAKDGNISNWEEAEFLLRNILKL